MAITATFLADFRSFESAVRNAEVSLKSFESSTGKVEKSLNQMANSLSGQKIISQAQLMSVAVDRLGGVSKLTEAELRRVGATVNEAAEKMRALGGDASKVPPEMQKIIDATTRLNAPTQQAVSWWGKFGDQIKATALGFVSAQAIIAGVQTGVRLLTQFVADSVKAAAEAEAAQRKLTQALEAAGRQTPENVVALTALAKSFQLTTVYSDDLITEMQALLTQVGNVAPSEMEKALRSATNLASGLGIDLRTATMLVGKAFEGETGTLKRYGIVIDEAKLKTEGVSAVMDAIQAKFGGQAQAEVETYSGKIKQLANTWNDYQEVVGRAIIDDPLIVAALRRIRDGVDDIRKAQEQGMGTATEWWARLTSGESAAMLIRILSAYAQRSQDTATALARLSDVVKPTASHIQDFALVSMHASTATKALHDETVKGTKATDEAAKAAQRFHDSIKPLRLEVFAFAPSLTNATNELQDFIGTLDAGALEFRDIYDYMEEVNDELVVMPKALASNGDELRELAGQSDKATDSLGDLAQAFSQLAQIAGGGLGDLIRDMGSIVGAIDTAQESWKTFQEGMNKGGASGALSMASGVLGMVGAVGSAIQSVVGIFKSLFGKSKNLIETEKATADLQKFYGEWVKVHGGIDRARLLAEAFGTDINMLGNKGKAGLEAVQRDLGALDEKWNKLQGAMDRYGISLEELGPKFQQLAQNDWAEQLSSDFAILMEAGAASDAVLLKMKEDVNSFIARSIRMGTEVPDSMIPMLEKMAEMGILTDENGNLITDLEGSALKFSKTMTEAFAGVEAAILALPEAIAKALGVIPSHLNIPVEIGINYRYPDQLNLPTPPEIPEFQGGTHGQYLNFGKGTLAMLHDYERISRPGEGVSMPTENLAELRQEISALRRDFTMVIPGLIARATATELAKGGR